MPGEIATIPLFPPTLIAVAEDKPLPRQVGGQRQTQTPAPFRQPITETTEGFGILRNEKSTNGEGFIICFLEGGCKVVLTVSVTGVPTGRSSLTAFFVELASWALLLLFWPHFLPGQLFEEEPWGAFSAPSSLAPEVGLRIELGPRYLEEGEGRGIPPLSSHRTQGATAGHRNPKAPLSIQRPSIVRQALC